jgi:hypothetical protein
MPGRGGAIRAHASGMPTDRLPLCDDPNVLVPEILAEWQAVAIEEPWMALPEHQRFDSLPDVLCGLLDAAICQPNAPAAYRTHVETAAKHGTDRRTQGFPRDLILTEFYLLREAIWRVIRRRYPADAGTAVLRVDNALTIAMRASLLGFHRGQLEAAGQWPAAIDQLVDDSPLVQPVDAQPTGAGHA